MILDGGDLSGGNAAWESCTSMPRLICGHEGSIFNILFTEWVELDFYLIYIYLYNWYQHVLQIWSSVINPGVSPKTPTLVLSSIKINTQIQITILLNQSQRWLISKLAKSVKVSKTWGNFKWSYDLKFGIENSNSFCKDAAMPIATGKILSAFTHT